MFRLGERFAAANRALQAPFGPPEIYRLVDRIQKASQDDSCLPKIRVADYNHRLGFVLGATSSLVYDSIEWELCPSVDGKYHPKNVLSSIKYNLCGMGLNRAPIAKARMEAVIDKAYKEVYPPAIVRAVKEFLDPGANTPTVAR